jgi:hypothetical protein
MPECYAHILGDCDGNIEEEHFIPLALQSMFGPVTLSGFAWQEGSSIQLQPGAYAKSRIICQAHHDQLDGLDANAIAYFRNLMLMAGKYHVATGEIGSIDDIKDLNGRALERWLLKTVCGAIKAKTIQGVNEVPREWIYALFERRHWPDDWAFYVFTGERVTKAKDARFNIQFHWDADRALNGININAFSVETLFAIRRPDNLPENALRRPKLLRMRIQRPDGGDVLMGVPAGQNVEFNISWPG